jgi:Family of unknown function (DUF5764)
MGDSIAGVYSDARSEYTKQLCGILIPSYFQFYLTILEKAREESVKTNDPKKLLWHFQTFLNDIPEWNMEKVNTEIGQIQSSCGCDYLEDLLTAVFIAHTKVLTAIRVSNKQKKVQITVPKVEHFLFKVLCETSKLLWGSSFLFREGIPAIEKQQNYRSIETLLGEGILQAVRAMVPVKSILRDFVSMDDDKEEAEEEKAEKAEKEEEEAKPEESKVEEAKVEELKVEEAKVEAAKVEEPKAEEVKVEEPKEESKVEEEPKLDEKPKNEVIIPSSEPPLIRIDTGNQPRVGFAEYNSFFDSENENGSDILRESSTDEIGGGLEILEDAGTPLDLGDIEDLNPINNEPLAMDSADYDVLS